MARKVVRTKELRAEAEAAEKKEKSAKAKKAPKKTAKKTTEKAAKKTVKKATKRKSRAAAKADIRLKAFWGVFNQSLKRVALFEYSERKKAEKKASDLSSSGKPPHFVQPVKEVIEEE